MPARRLPVRPDLEQLRRQAKELLAATRAADAGARAVFAEFHPAPPAPAATKLADAQLVLARSHGARSWMRLVQACELAAALWEDDEARLGALVAANPELLHEPVLLRPESNWGPPLSYAANLGRERLMMLCRTLGARDLEHALGRAALQGQVGAARLLHGWLGAPRPADDALAGPAYTLSVAGTELLFELGARAVDEHGKRLAPVEVVLESDSRVPRAKHALLELYARHGLVLPDTPTMALHRGRIDLLEQHLARDPRLLARTFTHDEIYPAALGCHDEVLATQGTPLAGTTERFEDPRFVDRAALAALVARGGLP